MTAWPKQITKLSGLMLLSLALLMAGHPVWGQQNQGAATVHVLGSSPIRGEDLSSSRQAAIDQCLEAAVSQALLEAIPQERLVANFQVVGEAVYRHTDQFISDYKVLTESTQGKVYRVLVQATISIDRLVAVLTQAGIPLGQKNEMRVLLCVAEKKVTDLNYQYWWGNLAQGEPTVAPETLGNQLHAAGITVVNADSRTYGTLGYPATLDVNQATDLARQMKANMVVVGRAMAEEAPNTMGSAVRSFRGAIELNAYLVDTGEQVAHIAQDKLVAANDLYQGGKDALLNVTLQAGETLARELQVAWRGQGSGTAAVEMVIEGTGGHIASFVQFRGILGTMSGVDSLQLKEMTPDSAILSVVYQGNARSLAEALLLKNFETFGINIVETGNRYIRLQLIPR
jgi:hypothetical protein